MSGGIIKRKSSVLIHIVCFTLSGAPSFLVHGADRPTALQMWIIQRSRATPAADREIHTTQRARAPENIAKQ